MTPIMKEQVRRAKEVGANPMMASGGKTITYRQWLIGMVAAGIYGNECRRSMANGTECVDEADNILLAIVADEDQMKAEGL